MCKGSGSVVFNVDNHYNRNIGELLMIISKTTKDGTLIKDLKANSQRLILVRCEICRKKRFVQYQNIRIRFDKHKDTTTPCKNCSIKGNNFAKGQQPWNKGKSYFNGNKHPQWTGGVYISNDGYKMVYVGGKHKHGWSKYRKEHIVLMEKKLGRKLKHRVVHHINGNKQDNHLSNLAVIPSQAHHRNVHQSLQLLAFNLVVTGFIKFDKKSFKYVADRKLRELLEQPEVANQQPSPKGKVQRLRVK